MDKYWNTASERRQDENETVWRIFGDALGLYEAVQWNFKPYYDWVSMNDNGTTDHKKDSLLICKEVNFGDLIYRIGNEENTDAPIRYLNKNRNDCFNYYDDVQENGYLLLSINEDKPKEQNTQLSWPQDSVSIKSYFKEKDPKYYDYHKKMIGKEAFGKFIHSAWNNNDNYKDNIGQILVAIEIQRKIDNVQWRKRWYRDVENNVMGIWNSNRGMAGKTFLTLLFIIIAIFYAIIRILFMLFGSFWYLTVPCLLVLSWYFRAVIIQVIKRKHRRTYPNVNFRLYKRYSCLIMDGQARSYVQTVFQNHRNGCCPMAVALYASMLF